MVDGPETEGMHHQAVVTKQALQGHAVTNVRQSAYKLDAHIKLVC